MMLVFILVTIATAVTGQQKCPPKFCTFTGTVSTTSDQLELACRCQVPGTHSRFEHIKINQKTHHKEMDFLADFTVGQSEPELDKYNQNYKFSSNGSSINATLAVLVLVFSNLQPRYDFMCTVFKFQKISWDADVFQCSYIFIRGGHPEVPENPDISVQMVIIIIVSTCSVIIIATIVAFVIAKRTRSKPAVPVDAVPLEVVKSLLTAVTSPEARSIRHVTPSSRKEYVQDGSYVSGTYVLCQSEASTLYDLIPPSLPGDDVKMRVWLNDVKNRQGDGEIEFANEHSAWSDDYDDHDNDAALRTSHRDMFAQHAITNVNRKLPPIPVDQRPPPGVDEAPRLTSPVNPQSSQANADLDLHLSQSTPHSPELTTLPIAPRLPVEEHPLPEEDGYIDMASAPSLDDQCGQISGSVLSQSEDGYMTPVHPSLTGSTIGKKQNSRERSTAGGQHLYLASDTEYLSPVCQQKTIAGRRVEEEGRPNCRPRDPTYLTPV